MAAAVTGHLGPDAPAELDGVVFIAVAWRGAATAIECAGAGGSTLQAHGRSRASAGGGTPCCCEHALAMSGSSDPPEWTASS